ncbi:MAG: hypothetical protein IJX26_02280 [Clostridia bacterium]|nr:hypothetical protein [Clostridia bacterium]
MLTPKDLIYINTYLHDRDDDSFYFYNNNDEFQVVINNRKNYTYTIKFNDDLKAQEFLKKMALKEGLRLFDYIKIEGSTITTTNDHDNFYCIFCGENEMLAQKLVKMFRKQEVLQDKNNKKPKVESAKVRTRNEIKGTGIKF